MMLLLLILCLLGYFIYFKDKFNLSYSVAIPVSTSLIVSLLYISALLRILDFTVYFIYILGVVLFIYYIINNFADKKLLTEFFSHDLLFLLVAIGIYYVRITPSYYISWDDFTHWGTAAKEIHLYKGLHTVSDLTSLYPIHFNYTRIPALFCYFITKSIGYTEGNNMFAMGLLCMLFSSTVLVRRSMLQSALLFFSVLAAAILYTPILRSLYIDGVVGIIFGCVISIYLQEKHKARALLYVLPILFILPNIKEIGFWLAYLAIAAIIIDLFIRRELKGCIIFYILPLLIAPYVSHKLWVIYLNKFNIISSHSTFNIVLFFNTFIGLPNLAYGKAILLMFMKTLPEFAIKEGTIVIYSLFAMAVYLYRKYQLPQNELVRINSIMLVLFSLYLSLRLFIWLHYAGVYLSSNNKIQSSSYLRYYGSFFIAFAFIAAIFIKKGFLNSAYKKTTLTDNITLIFTLIFFSIISYNLYKRPPITFDKDRKLALDAASPLLEFKKNNHKVMIIFNNVSQFHCPQIIYEIAPYGTFEELDICRNKTGNFWPDSYKLEENFTIDFDMFNDKLNNNKNSEKYDILYITSLDDNSERILAKALGLKEVKDKAFIKINGKFTPYKT
ncbi:hypothetical protein H1Q59_01645 [Holosporaceae bacterium 'Namur']|nr:hypothetical protein [Holosporaceae bacterium 'Namur']